MAFLERDRAGHDFPLVGLVPELRVGEAVQEAAWRALNTPFAPNYSVVFLSARDHTPISVSACSSHNRMSISR